MTWQIQKMCADNGNYELVIERMKNSWHCEQSVEGWRWTVAYHGAVVSQGSALDEEQARILAEKNVPA